MSVDSKIKELLERVKAQATDAETLSEEGAQPMGSTSVAKDTSIKPANAGDTTHPMQGSSQKANIDVRDEEEPNQGMRAATSVSKNSLSAKGPGTTPNFTTIGDPANAVNQPNSASNVQKESTEEPSLKEQIISIFGEDVSEDFANRATSIFEAAVVARVNSEMEKIVEQLEEQKVKEFVEAKEYMIEKIDSFLNYVVEQWMIENELAIENGLRTEIAEDFIVGMKSLFKEHYIEIPEEKYNVIGELQEKADTLESKLDEALNNSIELKKELDSLKRHSVLENISKDLADTEAEKLVKLLEGVDFENEELFTEKVSVIKENYFPKNNSVKQASTSITEDSESPIETLVEDSTVSRYAKALSRTIKK